MWSFLVGMRTGPLVLNFCSAALRMRFEQAASSGLTKRDLKVILNVRGVLPHSEDFFLGAFLSLDLFFLSKWLLGCGFHFIF